MYARPPAITGSAESLQHFTGGDPPVPSVHSSGRRARIAADFPVCKSVSQQLRSTAILLVSVLWASLAAAQAPVINPRFLEFNASTDHSATLGTGEPKLTRYDLEFYNIGAASPFQTNSLGKPTPNGSGVIRIDLATTFAALPTGVTFEARVAAVGPGGTGRSSVSNQFAFTNPCTTTIAPTGATVGAATSTGSVSVTTGTGCAWTAVSNAGWVTISSGASGSGNGTVTYSIAANTAPTARSAALTIGGQTFSISQAAGCTFTISPTSLAVTSGPRTGTVSVSSGAACAWTAASSASWITITSGASGSGNGSVGYSIAANTTISPRSGVVTIAGLAFTVTQDGIPCNATISPTGVSSDAAASAGTIAVSIPAGCAWTAADNASWVSITSGASGTGNGNVAYTIAANPNTTQRTATITVAGQSFGITQAGVVCSLTISPTASSPTHAGGASTVAVTANASSCPWTAGSNDPWITVTAGSSGSGSGSVSYNVAANSLTSSRTGTMTIAGRTMTVTQSGVPCNFTISPTTSSLGPEASTNTVAVSAPAGCPWTATESSTWISITSGASGSGNGTVTYAVVSNPSITPRSTGMTIAGQSFNITQAGQACTYTLNPAGASVPAGGTTGTVDLTAMTGCAWTATSSAAWVTVTTGANGSGNGTIGYSVAANGTTSPRTGGLTIGGQAFTITQAGGACTYTVNPGSESFTEAGGPGSVALTTQGGCAWNATTSAPWITISGGSGTGSNTINYTVAANPDAVPRSSTIAVGGRVVAISQAAAPCTYTLSPASVSVGSGGGAGDVTVTANNGCAWTAASGAAWLTISSATSGSGNGTVAYSVSANTTTAPRSATITLGGRTFSVTQAALACTFTLSSTSLSVPSNASSGSIQVTSAGGCSWTAVSGASWITVTSGASSSGSGGVSLSFAANTGGAPRTGTLTIAGQTVTVTQAGVPCTTTISPSSVSAPDSLTTGNVNVTSPTGCAWTAVSNTSWVTVTTGGNGTGPGAVGYSLAANTGTAARSGSITIGGEIFTVSQAGRSCAATFNPSSASIGTVGGGYTVDVTTGSGCTWSATASQAWITLTSGASGTGPGTIGFTVDANASVSVRSATISIGSSLFQISQAGTCSYSISPLSVTAGAGTTASTVFVFAAAGCPWTAASNAAWMTVTSGQSGTGGGSVILSATANNTGSARVGTATIAGHTFTLNQNACSYSVSPTTVPAMAAGATSNAFVNTTPGCAWSGTSSVPWMTMPSGNSGTGMSWLPYTVAPNPDPAPRSGVLTVAGRTLTVNQAAAPCTYDVSPTTVVVDKQGGTATVTVQAGSGCSWTVQSSLNWVTVTSGNGGTGSGTVTLQIAANPLAYPRAGGIVIAGDFVIVNQSNVAPAPSTPGNFRIIP
jgi:hypothetical protein